MAKKTSPAKTDEASEELKPHRLRRLSVRNYRCIGSEPVVIDLDEIVVLVGPNNVGKSSILRAYQIAMSEGSSEANLTKDDFPNGEVVPTALPEIELETVVTDFPPGSKWIADVDGERVVRERWIWEHEGKPKRQGFDVTSGIWSEEAVPWGAANVAQFGRPKPHRVDAFADPSVQAKELVDLLMTAVTQRVTAYTGRDGEGSGGDRNEYEALLAKVAEAQKRILEESKAEIEKVEAELSEHIGEIFPNHAVEFDARPEEDLEKCVQFFKAGARLLMGPRTGYKSAIELQGSGARRTLLWTALRILAAARPKRPKGKTDSPPPSRANVLLIDEPEICLHPSAIREACRVLYDLPSSGNWQVMATTHSPAFIDVSRDNTTIVRVERRDDGQVVGTTVFRPSLVQLDGDDRARLKLLNAYDPYVAEFFFGARNVLVEGDTEYTALKYVIAQRPEELKDIHVIRARGKGTILSLTKILNQFGSSYAILHDADRPFSKNGQLNSAWPLNGLILEAARKAPGPARVRVLASLPDFERGFLGGGIQGEKSYGAIEHLSADQAKFDGVANLLRALADHSAPVPPGATQWESLEALERALPAEEEPRASQNASSPQA